MKRLVIGMQEVLPRSSAKLATHAVFCQGKVFLAWWSPMTGRNLSVRALHWVKGCQDRRGLFVLLVVDDVLNFWGGENPN